MVVLPEMKIRIIGMLVAACAGVLSVEVAMAEPGPISTVRDAYASWSPDGTRIYFASTRSGNWDIWSIDADGENLTQLTENGADDHYPSVSPDGRTIAFVSSRDADEYDLFLMNADGSDQRRLDENPALDVHPMWHPGGNSLVFSSSRSDPDAENLDIYVIDVDGGGVRQLSSGSMNESLASYSADGENIIFEVQVPDDSHPLGYRVEIAVMPASGGEPTLLTEHFGTDAYPTWHAQSGKVVFASSRSRAGVPRFQIYSMDPDGKNVVRLIESSSTDARPSLSPDGKWLAFTRAAHPAEEGAMTLEIREFACTDLYCRIVDKARR